MDAINPAHGSVLRVNSPSLGIFSLLFPILITFVRRNGAVGETNDENGERKGRRMLGPSLLVSYSWPNIPFPSPCHLSPYSLVSFTRLVVYATRLTHSTRVTERGDKGTE